MNYERCLYAFLQHMFKFLFSQSRKRASGEDRPNPIFRSILMYKRERAIYNRKLDWKKRRFNSTGCKFCLSCWAERRHNEAIITQYSLQGKSSRVEMRRRKKCNKRKGKDSYTRSNSTSYRFRLPTRAEQRYDGASLTHFSLQWSGSSSRRRKGGNIS